MSKNKLQARTSALVLIYNEIESYPPTLNAIQILSTVYEHVSVLHLSNVYKEDFKCNDNVKIYKINQSITSNKNRIKTFYLFVKLYIKLIRENNFNLILFYDPIAAMTVYLAYFLLKPKPLLWYHNHDIAIHRGYSRNTLIYWGAYFQHKILNSVNIFSLPAIERLKYYNLKNYTGKVEIIPNYPSKTLYSHTKTFIQANSDIRIILQGTIDTGRGIEEFIQILPIQIKDRDIKLILKGTISAEYKKKLVNLIQNKNVESKVEFYGLGPYGLLPEFTSKCQIGIAIFTKTDIMNSTLGSASNKVYEYMASGLPFIYYDSPHFNKYFSKMSWAVPTTLSRESLIESIYTIIENYYEMSTAAKNDFLLNKNYENVFSPVMNSILKLEN